MPTNNLYIDFGSEKSNQKSSRVSSSPVKKKAINTKRFVTAGISFDFNQEGKFSILGISFFSDKEKLHPIKAVPCGEALFLRDIAKDEKKKC